MLFSVNPGPFNMKEHVLISIFCQCWCCIRKWSSLCCLYCWYCQSLLSQEYILFRWLASYCHYSGNTVLLINGFSSIFHFEKCKIIFLIINGFGQEIRNSCFFFFFSNANDCFWKQEKHYWEIVTKLRQFRIKIDTYL